MVCPPVRSIIHSLKLVDYLSVQADNPCSVTSTDAYIFEFLLGMELSVYQA